MREIKINLKKNSIYNNMISAVPEFNTLGRIYDDKSVKLTLNSSDLTLSSYTIKAHIKIGIISYTIDNVSPTTGIVINSNFTIGRDLELQLELTATVNSVTEVSRTNVMKFILQRSLPDENNLPLNKFIGLINKGSISIENSTTSGYINIKDSSGNIMLSLNTNA